MKIDPALTLEVSASTTAQGFAILLKFPWVPNYICGPIYSWIGQNSFFPFQSFGAYVADPKSSAKLQAKQTNSTLSLEQRLEEQCREFKAKFKALEVELVRLRDGRTQGGN